MANLYIQMETFMRETGSETNQMEWVNIAVKNQGAPTSATGKTIYRRDWALKNGWTGQSMRASSKRAKKVALGSKPGQMVQFTWASGTKT